MNDDNNKNNDTDPITPETASINATNKAGTDVADDSSVIMDEGTNEDDGVAGSFGGSEVKKLREKLKKAVEEKQQYLDGWQKERADFLNARKRDEKEKQEFIKFANEGLMTEIIPVLDSFSMAFSNKESWEKVDKNWRVGVEYIANQLKKALTDNGLVEIDPAGKKFDPMRDEAIGFEEIADPSKDQLISSVIQKGYSYNGRVLKAPKVKVGEIKKS